MAKKKSKKKKSEKKDTKKKILKLKLKKKKDSKKKDSKKKDSKKKGGKKKGGKKKDGKKKDGKKKPLATEPGQPLTAEKPSPAAKTTTQTKVIKKEDHSSNYTVTIAIKKLRALKSKDDLLSFTKGEKRLTIIKVIPAAMNRLK